MNRTTYAYRFMNIVDWNNQALGNQQGFGFAYTILNKRYKENM